MINDVIYERQTTFTGRNGTFKQTGLALTIERKGEDSVITLEPITSRKVLGNCSVSIPYGSINEVMDALNRALWQIENI